MKISSFFQVGQKRKEKKYHWTHLKQMLLKLPLNRFMKLSFYHSLSKRM